MHTKVYFKAFKKDAFEQVIGQCLHATLGTVTPDKFELINAG